MSKSKQKKDENQNEFVVDGKFIANDGTELPLLVVKSQIVRTMTSKMGSLDLFDEELDVEAAMGALSAAQQMEAMSAWESLCNYCLGFGVDIQVPESARSEMEVLAMWDDNEKIRRANYLQLLVLEDEVEVGNLVGSVIWFAGQADRKKKEKQIARKNQPSRKK